MIPQQLWERLRVLAADLRDAQHLRDAAKTAGGLASEDLERLSDAMLEDIAQRLAELRRELGR